MKPENENLIGLVLCGGKSSRMGRDKGLLMKDNKTWATLASEKIENYSFPTFISINKNQLSHYLKDFDNEQLIDDDFLAIGPLSGLISAHIKFPQKDILLLGVDICDISVETIAILSRYYNQESIYDNFVFVLSNSIEPLVAIYSYTRLAQIAAMLINRSLKDFSLKHVLNTDKTCTIEVENTREKQFKNYNFPEDIINT